MFLVEQMVKAKLTVSEAQARRLIAFEYVELNGVPVSDQASMCAEGDIITVKHPDAPNDVYQIPITTTPTPSPVENDWTKMDWTKV